MKYFAYSPDTGFDLYDTAEKAEKAAQESIDQYEAEAADGWNDEVESVCWGEVKQMAAMTNKRPPEPEDNSDRDYICDYELADVPE